MKKLFLLLTALAMSFSATMYAVPYLPDAEDAASSYLFDDNGQISGRNNAPQATYTYHFSFDEDGSIETQYFFRGSKSGLTAITLTDIIWLPLPNSETIQMQFSMGYSSSAGQTNYGQVMCPPVGTYTIVTTASSMNTTKMWAGGDLTYGSISSGTYRGYYYNVVADNLSQSGDINTTGYADSWMSYDGSSTTRFKSGSFTVEQGRHGYPYMYSSSLKDVSSNTLNITINDSRNLNTTYTSAEIATDADNKKVAMFAYNGTDNRMNLIFDVASIDANIGIPAGTYTVGTNVYGEIYDTDGYTTWALTSGTITISKSSNKISMSVSSLRGNDNDGTSRTLTISMSNVTPSVSAATSITSTNGTMSVPNSNSWHQIWGFDKDDNSYGMKVSVYKGVVPNGNVAASYSGNYNVSDVAYTHITKPSGDIKPNENYIVSNLYYDKRYKSGKAYIAMKGTDGQFYMATIYSTKWYSSSQMYMEYDKTGSFGPQNFAMLDVDEDDDEPGTYSITGNTGTYQISLARFHGGEGDGLIPSGEYDINPACFTNSLYIGGYDLNSAGTALDMIWGSYVYQNASNVWFLRSGTVTVTNINETYYVDVQARNSRVQSEQETYTVQYTLGTAPKTLTFNSDANGSVSASFNATNWGKTITDYAEGTAYPFFTGQTIVLTPTPADGYEFDSWTGATPTDNGDGTYSLTMASSDITVTANFVEVATVTTHTVTINPATNGTITVKDGETTINNGDQVEEGTVLTVTATPATGYHFDSWTNDGAASVTVNSNVTIGATFAINTYTVTIAKNEDDWGTISATSVANVPYGTVISNNGTTVTINGNTVTATPAAATAQYTYGFSGWTNGAATVTGAMTITANFTRTVNTYDITWKSEDGTSTLETDEAQAYGTATAYNGATTPTKTVTGYTYTFDGWATSANGEKAYNNGETPTVSGAATYYAHFTGGANTYTVTFAANGGSGTMADQAFTYGTPQNLRANTFTGPSATVTYDYNGATGGNSKASETVYATFSGWLGSNSNTYTDEQEVNNLTTTNGATVTMTAQWEMLAEVTLPQPTKTGYTLYAWEGEVDGMPLSIDETDDWSFFVTAIEPVTMTAQWNIVPYTITYEGLEGATNSNPTSYNVETATIVLADPGTRDGYIFAGWKDESDNTITQIAKGSTGDRTLTATWNAKSSDIVLCENCNDAHYNTFKTNYNGETVNVTYPRQFAANRWSTMCLPFNVNYATMKTFGMDGCVYEFKYATGNANVGSGVNLYFSNAKSIKAGTCYIVNANATLAAKTSFVFSGVTIDLSKDNGAALNSVETYNALPGYKSQGTIELVGTLRNGTLKGSDTGNTYMGLKSNKIYYPNISQGSTIWAYRGIFRSSEILDKESMQKMRIIVDGEDRGELIIDEDGDILAPSDAQSRKFIENGILYIEREGVIYDAQGKRIK